MLSLSRNLVPLASYSHMRFRWDICEEINVNIVPSLLEHSNYYKDHNPLFIVMLLHTMSNDIITLSSLTDPLSIYYGVPVVKLSVMPYFLSLHRHILDHILRKETLTCSFCCLKRPAMYIKHFISTLLLDKKSQKYTKTNSCMHMIKAS